jgi:HD-like signal output (HDOD) protein/GGDEF domain-containing protein
MSPLSQTHAQNPSQAAPGSAPAPAAAKGASPLEAFVRQSRGLYSMPAVAVEVLSLVDDPRADVAQLKTCIERDPALTSKLLRVVNGSLFGLARRVSDLNQAVALLGAKSLKLLALGFCLPDRLFAAKGSEALRQYWGRTLTRAVAARELAVAVGWKHDDEAFVAGLLASLGQLVLMQEKGEAYLRVFQQAAQRGDDLSATERQTFGFDHAQLTLRLLQEWHLPPAIVEAVEASHGAESTREDKTAHADSKEGSPSTPRIVRLAERLAVLLVDERADLWPAILEEAAVSFRLSAERLAAAAEKIQRDVDELAKALKIEASAGQAYREVLERASQLSHDAAEDALTDLLARDPQLVVEPDAAMREEIDRLHAASERAAEPEHASEPTGESAFPDLTGRLAAAVAECRGQRRPLSFALLQVDRFAESSRKNGFIWSQQVTAAVVAACRGLDRPPQIAPVGAGKLALIMPCVDRMQALDAADEIFARFRAECVDDDSAAVSLSCGVATVQQPPRNFPPQELMVTAERCLYAAAQAAGDTAKSLEIF